MMLIDLTAQWAPVYWGLIAVLVLCGGAIAAMVERRPQDHPIDIFLPERLFVSEALAVAAGVALFVIAATTFR